MKLDKNKWENIKLDKCVHFIRGVTYSKNEECNNSNGIGILRSNNVDFDNYRINFDNLKFININAKIKKEQRLIKNDILISIANSKEQTGKIGFAFNDTNYYIGGFMAVLRPLNITPYFLFLTLSTNNFKQYIAGKNQGTTSIWNITFNRIKDFTFPLPPLSEQRQIVSLFQNLENCIEQAEQQEKNLKALLKKLVDDFVSNEPVFGNLIQTQQLKKVRYADVAQKIMRKINPVQYGVEKIVAGENLESEDFKIRTWGIVGKDALGPAFHVLFKPGDILYGSRRTYLKKVALADFEGVCANTTYVIRANEKLLLQDLLKYIMLSERFTKFSIGVSKGSTNPYINWKDLDNFFLQIPNLAVQKKIVDVLDSIYKTIEQLKSQQSLLKQLKYRLLNDIL
ncbi:MAG: restriction endonuclease subunit S [Paludibacter sp.]|nr:restriction endonuclease subunit S [Paludibacter sp.]